MIDPDSIRKSVSEKPGYHACATQRTHRRHGPDNGDAKGTIWKSLKMLLKRWAPASGPAGRLLWYRRKLQLYPAKLLGCFGDGGAIITNDDEIYEKPVSSA